MTKDYERDTAMSSPVFKSQHRALTPSNIPRPKKLVMSGLSIPVGSSSMQDDKDSQQDDEEDGFQLSPILWSQRALGPYLKPQDAKPWKKLKKDENNITKGLRTRPTQSPTSSAVLHDDSFVENIDFEEIDSICLSMESTPKRKVRNTSAMRMSPNKKMVSHGYRLRHTPQRAKSHLKCSTGSSFSISGRGRRNESGKENEQALPIQIRNSYSPGQKGNVLDLTSRYFNQSFCGKIGALEERSPSSSEGVRVSMGISNSCISKQKVAPNIYHGDDGRKSPDLFGEADLEPDEHLSESMDAELALIEDNYYNRSSDGRDELHPALEHQSDHPLAHQSLRQSVSRSGHPPLPSSSQHPQKHSASDLQLQPAWNPLSLSSPCDHPSVESSPRDQSVLKCQDSQLSFSSTLESQPLIERLENKLKAVSTSSQVDEEAVQPATERRAAALAAALDHSAQSHSAGQDLLHLGPFYGLPSSVVQLLREHRGISQLYEWQDECIRAGSDGSNLLICQPTSGGKTLVAEIIILQHILLRQCHAIFVLPYVALVQEKVRGLSIFGVELGFLVEEYAGSRGSFPPQPRRNKRVVYVATIEKAGGLVNWMMETGGSGGVGLVVVDEVHMLAEQGGRGASLEATLTKLRFSAPDVQLVGMSATVGNLKELAKFLGATLHHGTFRPVKLTEHIKVGGDLWEINPSALTDEDTLRNHRITCFPYNEEQLRYDRDQVGGLVGEVLPQHSCLVFCPTRRSCEAVAEMLCRVLPQDLKQFRHSEKVSLYRALVEEGGGSVCPILRKTIPFGIAYHHSGVTEGERKALEEGYLAGTLCCICCTSTLAAGINLPARRVIIRAPFTGREFLTRARYKQMVGRAGRAGLDTSGESYLILQPQHLCQARSLLVSDIEDCRSTLEQNDERGLTSLVFSAVALGVTTSLPSLTCLTHTSLWALQASRNLTSTLDIDAKVRELVERLRKKGLVRVRLETDLHSPAHHKKDSHCPAQHTPENGSGHGESPCSTSCLLTLQSLDKNAAQAFACPVADTDVLTVSRLGHAAIKGNVDLDLAGQLYADLCVARENLAVNSHLHLLYLVTPYQPLASTPLVPDVLYAAYMALGEEELKVARLLGITEGVVVKLRIGHKSKADWSVVERFYVALLLHQVWCGAGIWEASATFHVHRGFTQQTLTAAAAFASSVYHFCQELKELWAFRDLLANFTQQLSSCCSAELLPLMNLPAVKRGRARQLYRAGYHTLHDVARADTEHLVKAIDHLSFKMATQLVNSAKMLLLERAETLQVETEEVMLGLRDPQPVSPDTTAILAHT